MVSSQMFKWSLKSAQEMSQGRVVRITIFLQSKILEIIDENDSVFYLIYFKHSLLGGGALEKIEKGSFLYKAYHQGIQIQPHHPLFSMLIPKARKTIIPNTKSLFTQLQDELTLHEIAIAATFMDSFIEKSQLISIIREIFNHYRRDGQLLKAYQISKILFDFSEDKKAIRSLVRIPEFEKYRKIEETSPMALLEKNSLLLEAFYFLHMRESDNENKLHQLLMQQKRHSDRLFLFIHQYEVTHDFSSYREFKSLMQQLLKHEDQLLVLTYLYQIFPHHPLLVDDLLHEQIQQNQYPEALTIIANLASALYPAHREQVEMIIEQMEPTLLVRIPYLNQLICSLYPTMPQKKEDLIRRLTTCLLEDHDPTQVIKWLEPIQEATPNLQTIKDLLQLERLSNDLDQLQKLGEIYYQLGLLDQSIESFTWEMELKPTSMEPVRWLSKLYQEKGMKEEAETYRKLTIMMSKGMNHS